MKKLSLQLRLIIFFILISGSVFLTAGILSWYEGREKLDEFFDTYQMLMGRKLSSLDWQNFNPESQSKIDKLLKDLDDDGEEDDDALGFAVFNLQGDMLFHDGNEGKFFQFNGYKSGFNKQKIGEDHEPWRIFWIESIDKQYIIAIGQELDFREDAAFDLVEDTLLPWAAGLTILLIAAVYMVSREFRPLKRIAHELRHRDSNDLSPVDNENMPTEIKPMVGALNNLFIKIRDTLKRERSFISDSAHELRSPLTALKVQLEVAELAGDDAQMRQETLQKLGIGINRASRLVEQLLELSRLEASKEQQIHNFQSLDWNEIISKAIQEQLPSAQNQKIDIIYNHKEDFGVTEGAPLLWSLLLRNLLDNAIRYSPFGAKIVITSTQNTLSVFNSGVVVEENLIPRLKERFFRPPGQTQSGSGLGLSIVERIAQLHHCSVYMENIDNGFCVSINILKTSD